MSALRLAPAAAAWAQAAADVVNTGPRATNPVERLLVPEDLERLLPEAPPPFTGDDLPAVREVRARLRDAFLAADMAGLAAVLNPLLGEWGMQPAPAGWALGPATRGGVERWLGARAAWGLAELATTYGRERLHVCAADDCLRAVADVSRNGSRRYCSRTCASRMNVRRFRELHAG